MATSPTLESRTRDRVVAAISERGPITVADLADDLGLTQAAVRRHLDNLTDAGLVTARELAGGPRRRGRPAKAYVVSQAGHSALSGDYADVAIDAVRFLREAAGEPAVRRFAETRMAERESSYAAALDSVGTGPGERVDALVAALTGDGFAASARPVGVAGGPARLTGVQLCQGHCPVQHVAEEFPEFCDAETDAFSRLLGVHVQRLATLAHGEHVCTTFVPTTGVEVPHGPDTVPTERHTP